MIKKIHTIKDLEYDIDFFIFNAPVTKKQFKRYFDMEIDEYPEYFNPKGYPLFSGLCVHDKNLSIYLVKHGHLIYSDVSGLYTKVTKHDVFLTLVHEFLHAVFVKFGLREYIPYEKGLEEKMAEGLTRYIISFFKLKPSDLNSKLYKGIK